MKVIVLEKGRKGRERGGKEEGMKERGGKKALEIEPSLAATKTG